MRDESSGKMHTLLKWMYTRSSAAVILLQEHHLRERQCRDAEMYLRQNGVESRFTPRDDDTASRGTAVIVRVDKIEISREHVKFDGGEHGTITTAHVKTPERTYHF